MHVCQAGRENGLRGQTEGGLESMTIEDLQKAESRVAGTKLVLRALAGKQVRCAFVADDADLLLTQRVVDRCYEQNLPCVHVSTMQELGRAAGIAVGAAAACILR